MSKNFIASDAFVATDAIAARRSVRTYDGTALDDATAGLITDFVAGLRAPFGAECRIELVRGVGAGGNEPVKLGTYGAIRGASDYLALVIRDGGPARANPLAQQGAAWVFEQTVLFCTSLGLGTCWLAGFLDRGGFRRRLSLGPGERLRSVSPVGRAAEVPHRSLVTMMNGGRPTPRRDFGETFFGGVFGEPLSEDAAGVFARPLEMVRRAPSANNKQPWRVVMAGGGGGGLGGSVLGGGGGGASATSVLHFYAARSMGYEALDLGIAMCHFELTCREMGIPGHFEVLPGVPAAPKAAYVASWINPQ